MANCLAPGYVKIHYNSNTHDHVMVLPIIPSGTGTGLLMQQKSGGTVAWVTGVAALIAILKDVFHTTDSFNSAEVFTQADCDSAPVFQDSHAFTGVNGTQTPADVPWTQDVMTFRTAAGGRAKIQLMETVYVADIHVPIPGGSGSETDAIAAYAIGGTSWIVGRDGAFLNNALNQTTKINDTLRKKYLGL